MKIIKRRYWSKWRGWIHLHVDFDEDERICICFYLGGRLSVIWRTKYYHLWDTPGGRYMVVRSR